MSRSGRIVCLVLFAIGLPFLAGAAITFVQAASFVWTATKTQGTYAGSVARSGGGHGGTFLYPQFRFSTRDGRVVTVTSTWGSTDQPYDAGGQVAVLYDPRHPERGKIDSFQLWLAPLFLAPFGLLFAGIPMTILIVARRRRQS